jgi:Tfp pilus assembly protein PilF
MKKIEIFTWILILIIFSLQGCTKRLIPGVLNQRDESSYDSTAFYYVYIEALKQKFLGNEGDALKYLEQCIRINPSSDAAYYEIAKIAFQKKDLANAKMFSLKSVKLNEKNVWYLTLLGSIYYQQRLLDSAIIYYGKAVKYFPEKENLKLTLGNFYAEKGDYSKANEIFNYFENQYGVNESTTLFLIKNLMNSGDLKGAEEKIKLLLQKDPDEILYNGILAEIYRAEGEKEKAAEIYRSLMERDSENPQTLLSLADFLITEKEYDELFKLLDIIVLNTYITREDKISLLNRLIENDEIIKSGGKKLEMIILVMEATYKNDDIIYILRPELYQRQQNIDEAIDRLEDLIEINSENYYAWEKLLILYSEKRDYNNLFIKGNECATKFNMSFLAKILYASAALEKNELEIAQEELRKAKILAGDNKEMIVQVLTVEADLFYRKKEFTKSYEIFKEALKYSPEDMVILNNYAYYLAEQGEDLKEAERMARIVIEKEKNNGTYMDTYAWILYKRGKIKEAARIMEAIIKNGKNDDAEWCEHYGFIMKAMNQCDKAVEYWKQAQSLDNRKDYLSKEIKNCTK